MREIKFRAWDTQGKTMLSRGRFDLYGTDGLYGTPWKENCPLVFMQYTGLRDKNGKEIYEGDIVTDGEFTGEVYYHDYLGYSDRPGEMAYVVGNRTKPAAYRHLGRGHAGDWEILGNIYENPELLKGEV